MASKSKSSVWKYFEVSKKDFHFLFYFYAKHLFPEVGNVQTHSAEYILVEKESERKKILIESSAASTLSDYEKKVIITGEF